MAAKKKSTTKVRPLDTESFGKSKGGKEFESPVANTGASPVFRVDLGEALPPQAAPKDQS